jgi:hypothetical protein
LVETCDIAAAVLLAIGALGVGAVAIVGSAGPFGIALVVPGLLGLVGLAPLLVGLGLRVFGRRSGGRTGRVAAVAGFAVVVALVALPVSDFARARIDDRRAEAARRRLEAIARSCAEGDDFTRCMRAAEPTVGCTPSGCFTTLVELPHARRRIVLIDTEGHARLISDENPGG